jgi:hypothetical protein
MISLSEETQNRFWRKVCKGESCWLWTAAKANTGYGAFGFRRNGRTMTMKAHRVAYELCVGPIPEGMILLHKCDVAACVNPDHLSLGTKAENNRDMQAKGRKVSGGSYERPHRYKRGTEHHAAKLTPDLVRQLRSDQRSGMSESQLGRKYGLSAGAAGRVARCERWKHVC